MSQTAELIIREARGEDVSSITRIWQRRIEASLGATVEYVNRENWFAEQVNGHDQLFKIWLAVVDEQIMGWQGLLPTHNNPVLAKVTAQSSTYVDPDCHFRGIATALIKTATSHADVSGLHFIVGDIAIDNSAMRHICQKAGWIEIGCIPAGKKVPEWPERVSVVYVASINSDFQPGD
jgi:L-amino acid N-acyltransferase YncA